MDCNRETDEHFFFFLTKANKNKPKYERKNNKKFEFLAPIIYRENTDPQRALAVRPAIHTCEGSAAAAAAFASVSIAARPGMFGVEPACA
jgi:hypothetical protein